MENPNTMRIVAMTALAVLVLNRVAQNKLKSEEFLKP
jgi:hypothetical protein